MKIRFFPILLLIFFLAGCGKSPEAANQSWTWDIQINQVEVQQTLQTTEISTLYNGEKSEIEHENTPAAGNVFLILDLEVKKTGDSSQIFEWENILVMDAEGSSYQRHENDSFIEQHDYNPRMTGLPIRIGENQGWACFEIPQKAANGKLYLVHNTSEGQNKIEIKK